MTVSSKSFDEPDEQRTPPKTTVDVVRLSGATVARVTFEAGWKWSDCVKPVVGTDSCQARHIGALVSGEMEVLHEDGSTAHISPGEAYVIEPAAMPGWSATSRSSGSSSRAPRPTRRADYWAG